MRGLPKLPRRGQVIRCVLLFGFAPGDAYHATHVTMDAVGSYPAFSPLPAQNPILWGDHRMDSTLRRCVFCGADVGSLRLGVTQHPALWSPDFPLIPFLGEMSDHPIHSPRPKEMIKVSTGGCKSLPRRVIGASFIPQPSPRTPWVDCYNPQWPAPNKEYGDNRGSPTIHPPVSPG